MSRDFLGALRLAAGISCIAWAAREAAFAASGSVRTMQEPRAQGTRGSKALMFTCAGSVRT